MLQVIVYLLAVIAAVAMLLEHLYLKLRLNSATRRNQTMTDVELAPLARFYYCAIIQTFHLSPGRFYPSIPGEKLHDVDPNSPDGQMGVTGKFHPSLSEKVMTPKCYMRFAELEIYKRVIGYKGRPGTIPPVFMCCYFNKAIISLGCSEFSRARILGMVHLRQQVTVCQGLSPLLHGQFTVTFLNIEYRMTPRGLQNTIKTSVWGRNDELMWEALVTGLSVLPRRTKGNKRAPEKKEFTVYKEEEIVAPANIGLHFARATQDWQPQHINKWTAKLVGFSSPIAHGLWSMAVSVDIILDNEKKIFEDQYPLYLDVSFKRPLVLPGRALLQYDKPSCPARMTNFRMVDKRTLVPILVGEVCAGESVPDLTGSKIRSN